MVKGVELVTHGTLPWEGLRDPICDQLLKLEVTLLQYLSASFIFVGSFNDYIYYSKLDHGVEKTLER